MINATGAGNATVVEVSVDGGEPKPIGSEKWASVGRYAGSQTRVA